MFLLSLIVLLLETSAALSSPQILKTILSSHMSKRIPTISIHSLIERFKDKTWKFEEDEIFQCRENLLDWYKKNRRKLPWRGDGARVSAYGTWVSEIMLQQTRVETVISYWNRWMEKFPSVQLLAQATPDEVNSLWAGLGYYRRCQQLLKGAQKVMQDFDGVIPDNINQLLDIPGIGPYTAGAISSIAFQKVEPLVDGNVIRVLTRLRAIDSELSPIVEKSIWALAKQIVDPKSPGDFNQALMELGATLCKPTNPECHACPVSSICSARRLVDHVSDLNKLKISGQVPVKDIEDICAHLPNDVVQFPRKVAKKKPRDVVLSTCVLSKCQGHADVNSTQFLFVRRPPSGLLQNQWEFPSIVLWEEENSSGKSARQSALRLEKTEEYKSTVSSTSDGTSDGESADNTFEKQVTGETEPRVKGVKKEIRKGTNGKNKNDNDECHNVVSLSENLSYEQLWQPFPMFFRDIIGIDAVWLDPKAEVIRGKNENSGGNRKTDLKTGETGVKGNSELTVEECIEGISSKFRRVVDVSSVTSTIAIEPIIHVFSHQRHTMHVIVKDVTFDDEKCNTTSEDNPNEKRSGDQISWNDSWFTKDSSKREIRWMTRDQIEEAGLTTGTKKVLHFVCESKLRSIISENAASHTISDEDRLASKKRKGCSPLSGNKKELKISSNNRSSIVSFFNKKTV